jgi:hypothetical protein
VRGYVYLPLFINEHLLVFTYDAVLCRAAHARAGITPTAVTTSMSMAMSRALVGARAVVRPMATAAKPIVMDGASDLSSLRVVYLVAQLIKVLRHL